MFGPDALLKGVLWEILEILIGVSIPIGIVTTFILLIDRAGNGLNELQRKKDEKNKKRRR